MGYNKVHSCTIKLTSIDQQHFFSALSSLEMLDNKLDFVQILPTDRSTRWCPSAMMVQIVERNPSTGREIYYTIPQANRKFV
ncbi:uncharacterized protein LOC27207664 isoform X1 [Drosophila simulans]|uniref:uncharacterized protein LOC27207664 isoform X1 n=1 Tax=Drosophila simulans TaxID=7240 RepID=UPI00192CFCC4|nr:uncharacterized protein LOC27207664 isoform X1 [Drosophila simulans]XP_044778811.1 uncharacterized protein LOC27207664 isoform X1 [Drosophila simulans]